MDYILPDSIFESHDSYVSEVRRIYKENNRSWYQYFLRKDIIVEFLLHGSHADSILGGKLSVCLFSDGVIFPDTCIIGVYKSASLVLKDISTILAFVSLLSSHESIFLDLATRAFFASFLITFIHSGKSKGVFGSIMPNTPYFSHTLFSIMPGFASYERTIEFV